MIVTKAVVRIINGTSDTRYLEGEKNINGQGLEISHEGVQECLSKGLSVLQGNADTCTTAANVGVGANQVIFNSSIIVTTSSSALTFNGQQLNVTNNISANNITHGLTAGTTINTTTGDLVLDSSNNKVHITANAEVDGSMTIDSGTNSSSKDTGALVITAGGLGVEGNIHCGGDIIAFSSSDIELKEDCDNAVVYELALLT